MKVALVLNGDPPSATDLQLLDACDAVVCADGGALAVVASGRVPTHVVGDMDSLEGPLVASLAERGCAIERHPTAKDDTDGELALRRALELRPATLTILGAHGGRTGMFLGALKLLRQAHDAGVDAAMVGRGETVRFVNGTWRGGARGDGIDIVAVDGDCRVVVEGCQWSGDFVLPRTSSRGVSNRITGDASVHVPSGTVLLVHTQPPTP